jgi:Tfp pilus assembly protein PilO
MARFNFRVSIKHLEIDKANSSILLAAAITSAIVIFSIIAARTLLVQRSYQSKVIGLRDKANKQLEKNIKAATPLVASYQTFEDATESVIGTPDKNSKIILDALPSKYDFPALATSLEGVIISSGLRINSITGTDNEASAEQDSISPKAIGIPFQIASAGNYANAKILVLNLERSIRPIKISALTLSGDTSNLNVEVQAETYYQPEKKLGIQQKIITNSSSAASSQKGTK